MIAHARGGRITNTALLLIAAVGGCGASMARVYTSGSPSPAPDAFTCVREQIKTVGFRQDSYDDEDFRVTARQYRTVTRPDVNFRRLVDRLEIKVSPGSGQAVTTLTATATTFGEYTTQRGPTEIQEKTSPQAEAAAQTILRRCGGE